MGQVPKLGIKKQTNKQKKKTDSEHETANPERSLVIWGSGHTDSYGRDGMQTLASQGRKPKVVAD